MTTIHDAYINALLADASYVNDLLPGITGSALTGQLTGRMTPELAKYIGDNFTVVSQAGRLASSFDATVWRNKSGQVYVSMRGTQELFDFTTDADLAASGLAHEQLVDMVNWWLRETTSADQLAKQIAIGLAGNDTLQGGDGSDLVDGGAGSDHIGGLANASTGAAYRPQVSAKARQCLIYAESRRWSAKQMQAANDACWSNAA